MEVIHSIILGVVEGLTEFLPISSTGHLILASQILRVPQTDFAKSFEIFIQLGAILSVIVLYFKDFLDTKKWLPIIIAFLPTAAVGLIFYKIIKTYLLGNSSIVLISLFVGGLALIIIEKLHKENGKETEEIALITYKQAFLIGLIQSISVIPGVSRSAATIVGGMLLGLKRKTAVEFSFVLAVPTMLAASGLDLIKSGHNFSSSQYEMLGIGFITSFIIATLSIKFLLGFVRNHNFIPFGIYRILAAIIFWLIILK